MDQNQLKTYLETEDGTGLFPLRKWDEVNRGKKVGKAPHPSMMDWPNKVVPVGDLQGWIKKGHNVGYRIREGELVVDMDPRNYVKSKEEVEDWIADLLGEMDFSDVLMAVPAVRTGSGGYHLYLKIEESEVGGWREELPDWKGVEFKKKGKYVVCAGSRHPDEGVEYKWVNGLRLGDRAVTGGLGAVLERSGSVGAVEETGGEAGDWRSGVLTPEQMEKWVLKPLDVLEFTGRRDEWLRVCAGCHHATNGEGEEEFVAWCLEDTAYTDDEDSIRKTWHSFKVGGGGAKTNAWSLLGVLRDQGVSVQGGALSKRLDEVEREHSVGTDFAGMADDSGEPGEESGKGVGSDSDEDEKLDLFFTRLGGDFKDLVPSSRAEELAKRVVGRVSVRSTDEEVTSAVRAILHMKGLLEQQDLLECVRTSRKLTRDVFKNFVAEIKTDLKEQTSRDLPRLVAEATFEVKFYNRKGLVYTVGQQIWAYNGKHWGVVSPKWVEKIITELLDKLRGRMKIKKAETTLVSDAAKVLTRLAAVNEDSLGLKKKPKSVVNCQNGEYWIEEGVLKLHRPESHLLQVLGFEHDDWADCPKFDAMLDKTFERFADVKEKKRFIYQLIGYVIDPNKELDKWIMFHGSGGDGKSAIINVIMAFLGDAVLPVSIGDFDKKNHLMAEIPGKLLVVDEDMAVKTVLPDGTLKKLSGHTQLSGDPKFAKLEYFLPACTVLLCGNRLPITHDISEAARRRPIVVPFDHDLHKDGNGGVKGIDKLIVAEELPGILNRAVIERNRIVEQGGFDVPRSSVLATAEWLARSNMIALFMHEQVERTEDRKQVVYLSDMYAEYERWCMASGIRKPSGKTNFREGLEALEYEYDDRLPRNRRGFRGVVLLGIEEFD